MLFAFLLLLAYYILRPAHFLSWIIQTEFREGHTLWGLLLRSLNRSSFRVRAYFFFFLNSGVFYISPDPRIDSASKRNKYQEYFLEVMAAGAKVWQPHHLHVPIVFKCWSLNLPEPSGPVQACSGTALPLLSHVTAACNNAVYSYVLCMFNDCLYFTCTVRISKRIYN
jgi:hypothetical protein